MQKQIGLLLKSLIIAFIFFIACLLLFRNHFIFGTALILGRWIFLAIGIILLFFTARRTTSKAIQYFLIGSVCCLALEFMYTKLNEARPKNVSTNTEVSFLTYNLFFKNKNPDVILNQITATNPDVFVVQELTPSWVSLLSKSFGKIYPYRRIYADNGTHGIGVYSKYKLSNDSLLLNERKKPFAQLVNVRISNKTIRLVNVHLASPAAAVEHPEHFFSLFRSNYSQREYQIDQIENALKINSNDASILIGDLNTTPYEPLYRNLKSTWVDVFNISGTGNGATFPNTSKSNPFLRLDYILVKGEITPTSVEVSTKSSSDHLGLMGKVKI